MITSLMVFHAVIAVLLIILVLLQFGKGAEAGLFSGGASDSVFTGSQQGNILNKITVVLAVIFFANSILMAKIQSEKSGESILDTEAPIAAPLTTGEPPTGEAAKAEEKAAKEEGTKTEAPAAPKAETK